MDMLPGETLNDFRTRVYNAAFDALFRNTFSTVNEQTEEGVRARIDRGKFKYAIKLMKEWYDRKPEDVDVLRRLKAYYLERRTEVRALKAEYARTYRKSKRAERIAEDVRACVVCRASLAGKRAGAETCSTKCRVKLHRNRLKRPD